MYNETHEKDFRDVFEQYWKYISGKPRNIHVVVHRQQYSCWLFNFSNR